LAKRKGGEADRRWRTVDALRPVLAAYASEHGGRFLVLGSAARGEIRLDSDVDVLVDSPPDALDGAWRKWPPASSMPWRRFGARSIPRPDYAAFASIRCAISVSAICTAFNAAPLRRLSDTHQNDNPFATVGSLRIRLTYTASSPALSSGVT
jgi:Nucleotidyltransferase domain